jgi:hypothetical protein
MPGDRLPEPYRRRTLDRSTRAAIKGVDAQVQLRRAQDRARAELAARRISDIAKVTRHGIAAAGLIAYEAEIAAQISPWAADQIAAVATTGIVGIRGVITDLADGF